MAHRNILTERQRKKFLALPNEESLFLQHYILSNEDLAFINKRNKPQNRFGVALQLCALRYPGRYITKSDVIPECLLDFIAAQIGIDTGYILEYAKRMPTRYEHLRTLQQHYGFRHFREHKASFREWLYQAAIDTKNNAELAELFVDECRRRKIILPGITMIERLCADARVSAERTITHTITSRLDERMKQHLQAMLDETVDGRGVCAGAGEAIAVLLYAQLLRP